MPVIAEKFANDHDFQEFLNRQFDKTVAHATIEELAEFAFGSIDAAIQAYEDNQKKIEDIEKRTGESHIF